ncbi:MAG: twin-arginine translocation signal domain-containing protein, partial [Nitrospinota bacterium]
MDLTRRSFLKISAAAAAGVAALEGEALALKTLKPVVDVENPLGAYPDRDWEKVYHDQYRYDNSFTYVCSPNDTHGCRVRAFVRNGIIMRVESNYTHQNAEDLYGNKATRNWNPRMCLKGYTFHRKVYGPYRMRYPIVRKGWKQWADDGFPYLSRDLMVKYKFEDRASDEFLRMTWDEVFTYIAKCLVKTAERYSGEAGAQLLRDEGYQEEMIRAMKGAGTRTLKFRGGMGQLQVMGIYGNYRVANMMAIIDANVRDLTHEREEEALGGRNWSNYTWHGDQAPGHPFVHGLQVSDID